jgi:uncharacterized protein (TIGR03435 family)
MPRNLWTSVLLSCVPVIAIGIPALQAVAQSSPHESSTPVSAAPNANFEVASIKESGPQQHILNALLMYPGARVLALGATLRFLLMEAYNLPPQQIVGGPAWIDKTRFDIEAKPPAGVASRYTAPRNSKNPPPDEIRQMLQNLLAERFQLKVHVQQSEGKVYELVRSGRPLHLSPPKDKNAFPWAGGTEGGPDGTGLRGINESMPDLAYRLSDSLHTPVVDRTGLSGSYDFLAVDDSDESGLGLSDGISQSLRQLGLKLKKSTGIVQTLVIDRVSLPSGN